MACEYLTLERLSVEANIPRDDSEICILFFTLPVLAIVKISTNRSLLQLPGLMSSQVKQRVPKVFLAVRH